MSRRQAEKIEPARPAALTEALLAEYAASLRAQGRREDSVRSSETALRQFYDALPPDRLVTDGSLSRWRDELLRAGYAVRTVNSRVSTVNALLEWMGRRDLQVARQFLPETFTAPELTRQEYVRMLQTARALGDERGYVLTKLFAVTGLAVLELPRVTVEAARAGQLAVRSGKRAELVRFPASLRADLARYARESGRTAGTIFTQRSGAPLARTQVSLFIQKLAEAAGVPAEKGNIRALRHLHAASIAAIEENFDLLVRQAYEQQLEIEELSAGWE